MDEAFLLSFGIKSLSDDYRDAPRARLRPPWPHHIIAIRLEHEMRPAACFSPTLIGNRPAGRPQDRLLGIGRNVPRRGDVLWPPFLSG
jgi:hypothetical protein